MICGHLQYSLYVTWISSSIFFSTCHHYFNILSKTTLLQEMWQCLASLERLGTISTYTSLTIRNSGLKFKMAADAAVSTYFFSAPSVDMFEHFIERDVKYVPFRQMLIVWYNVAHILCLTVESCHDDTGSFPFRPCIYTPSLPFTRFLKAIWKSFLRGLLCRHHLILWILLMGFGRKLCCFSFSRG